MKAFAVILAAGRGSRMKGLTAARPKCLLELAGKPLLLWQESALKAAGIEKIHVVKGYMADSIPERFSSSLNMRWAETNMLSSLLCASSYIDQQFAADFGQFVISYSDIVYSPAHVNALLRDRHDMAITYDTDWEELWRLRFENVLDDAETFLQQDGKLLEIGGKPQSISEIHGQYMGLLKLTQSGWQQIRQLAVSLGDKLDKTDMTSFLRFLLANGVEIGTVAVQGKWCEADNGHDLEQYETALAQGSWSHDWRTGLDQ